MEMKMPAGLTGEGARLWNDISSKWELRPDELRILADACAEAELIDDLARAMVDQPKLVRGSQGQEVINPLISEQRQHRATLASLLKQLRLPDENGDEKSNADRSSAAGRALVAARWGSKSG